jgi:nucleoside phosphorylase
MAKLTAQEYYVGWICALDIELTAAISMLDAHHESLPRAPADDNTYILGRVGKHNVVVAALPLGQMGTNSAAQVASHMLRTFTAIKVGLMVGIGGGVPRPPKYDIRLGDIVVSKPRNQNGGVLQYDFGRNKPEKFVNIGFLSPPPRSMLSALTVLKGWHQFPGESKLAEYLSPTTNPKLPVEFIFPEEERDELFKSHYVHVGNETCVDCDRANLVDRKPRSTRPYVHYGTIASGNQVVANGVVRDQLAMQHDIICFEMEAAGLMNTFPCVIIRGISDYSDSHKNSRWKHYAAATAAAYAKEFLRFVPEEQLSDDSSIPLSAASPPSLSSISIISETIPLDKSTPMEDTRGSRRFQPSPSAASESNLIGFGGLGVSAFSVLVDGSLSWNEVALGRLVLNLDDPGQDYYPPSRLAVPPEEIAVGPFKEITQILQKRSESRFATQFKKIFLGQSPRSTDPHEKSITNRSVTHKLLNSGTFLHRILKDESAKRWLEKVYGKGYVYLTVAIHSIVDISIRAAAEPSDVVDSGESILHLHHTTLGPGTQIIGAQFRKLRLERFAEGDFDSAYLTKGGFWKEYIHGDRAESDAYYEVGLDDGISLGDLRDHYSFEHYRSEYNGEHYLLLVCICLSLRIAET